MTYRFKVSLPNIKGFARVYHVNGSNSLYLFHKAMLSDMDFPQDQMILFKGLNDKGDLVARYATFDLGQGSVDRISVAKAIEEGITQFIYFYDTTNKRSVIITLEGEVDGTEVSKPTLTEAKGPNPIDFINGFVAFEDLPPEKRKLPKDDDEDFDEDDEDFDDEDEEDDDSDEDGAEIYDENL